MGDSHAQDHVTAPGISSLASVSVPARIYSCLALWMMAATHGCRKLYDPRQ
jgi:hypothetical protein